MIFVSVSAVLLSMVYRSQHGRYTPPEETLDTRGGGRGVARVDTEAQCYQDISLARTYLSSEGLNISCEALEYDNCEENFKREAGGQTLNLTVIWLAIAMERLYSCPLLINSSYVFLYVGPPASRYQQLAAPSSVYQRSLTCDLEWPRYSSVSREERELGLAYVITAFSDPRNLELSLATIFRPHNSYCVHIDTKSDTMFRYVFI